MTTIIISKKYKNTYNNTLSSAESINHIIVGFAVIENDWIGKTTGLVFWHSLMKRYFAVLVNDRAALFVTSRMWTPLLVTEILIDLDENIFSFQITDTSNKGIKIFEIVLCWNIGENFKTAVKSWRTCENMKKGLQSKYQNDVWLCEKLFHINY